MKLITTIAAALIAVAQSASAEDVWITPEVPFVEVEINDDFIVIERNQDNAAIIEGAFAKTSRACPPFCVQPMIVAEGVATVGEIEVLKFMEDMTANGNSHLIDARTPNFYEAGTIPGSINVPFTMFANPDTNPFLAPILVQLGGVESGNGKWNFSNPSTLLMFCNGPWCGQSPQAIRTLISIGYPPENLIYYRGGMQNWLMMGLTVITP